MLFALNPGYSGSVLHRYAVYVPLPEPTAGMTSTSLCADNQPVHGVVIMFLLSQNRYMGMFLVDPPYERHCQGGVFPCL